MCWCVTPRVDHEFISPRDYFAVGGLDGARVLDLVFRHMLLLQERARPNQNDFASTLVDFARVLGPWYKDLSIVGCPSTCTCKHSYSTGEDSDQVELGPVFDELMKLDLPSEVMCDRFCELLGLDGEIDPVKHASFLLVAVDTHRVDLVRSLKRAGVDINTIFEYSERSGILKSVQFSTHTRSTALHHAISNGDAEMIDVLFELGAEPCVLPAHPPLAFALELLGTRPAKEEMYRNVAHKLVEKRCLITDEYLTRESGYAAVCGAIKFGDQAVLCDLLANPGLVSNLRWTWHGIAAYAVVLLEAMETKNLAIVKEVGARGTGDIEFLSAKELALGDICVVRQIVDLAAKMGEPGSPETDKAIAAYVRELGFVLPASS